MLKYAGNKDELFLNPPSRRPVVENRPLQNGAPSGSSSELASSSGRPKKRRPGRPRRADGQDYETDYNSSGDELDDNDFDRYWENQQQQTKLISSWSDGHLVFFSEYPPITNEQQRNNYKREFDRDHLEYKDLQAELDTINKDLSNLDRELDELQEGSPQYLVRTNHYFIHYFSLTGAFSNEDFTLG